MTQSSRNFGSRAALTAVAVALVALWWLSRGARPADPIDPAPPARAAAAESPVEPIVASRESPGARLVGRCVNALTRAPLAGCTLTARSHERGPAPPRAPVTQTTREDGRFALPLEARPARSFIVDIESAEHLPLRRIWREIASGAVIDLGDVAMSIGATVSGRIADTNGVPRPDVDLSLHRSGADELEAFVPPSSASLDRRPDASFDARERLAPGEWRVHVSPAGVVLQEPKTLSISEAQPSAWLAVVVRAEVDEDFIAGVVTDDLGAPVAGAELRWRQPDKQEANGMSLRSRSDGSFRFARRPGGAREPVRISVVLAPGCEPLLDERAYAWGTADARLVLQRRSAVEIQVLDTRNGAPVETFDAHAFRGSGWLHERALRASGTHERGIASLENMLRGPTLLVVVPKDGVHAQGILRFDVIAHGTPRQTVRVAPLARQRVRVVRGDGSRVAGSGVSVFTPLDDSRITNDTKPIDLDALYVNHNHPTGLTLSWARTDANGEATLEGPLGEPCALRVDGVSHRALVKEKVVLDGNGVVELVVQPRS